MTEDEAKTKTCCGPMGLLEQGSGRSYYSRTCIASACMAWRWRRVANPEWRSVTYMAGYPPHNPFDGSNEMSIPSTTDGFCGLAGQP